MALLPGAEPYAADGGPVGVLLCHGFTGCPQSLRPWAEHLAGAGLTVRLPLLPGHGTTWRELAATRWEQWYAEVDRAFCDLGERCEQVVVMGLSMGGALALRLAEVHGPAVAGLVLVNPSVMTERRAFRGLWLLRHLVPALRGVAGDVKKPGVTEVAYDRTPLKALYSLTGLWALVREDLGRVTQPVLLLRSAEDHVVEASSSALVLSSISSSDVRERVLHDSYHVATLDSDAPGIFAESLDFVRRITTPAVTGG